MTKNDIPEFQADGGSIVSGVVHLFEREQVRDDGSAKSLCGAVYSYGPFRPIETVEGEVCTNCERVRERRDTEDET